MPVFPSYLENTDAVYSQFGYLEARLVALIQWARGHLLGMMPVFHIQDWKRITWTLIKSITHLHKDYGNEYEVLLGIFYGRALLNKDLGMIKPLLKILGSKLVAHIVLSVWRLYGYQKLLIAREWFGVDSKWMASTWLRYKFDEMVVGRISMTADIL